MLPSDVVVQLYADLADPTQVRAALESIFFEASATRTFPSEEARRAFFERWLGRYLASFPHDAFVAVTPAGEIAGYLAGCLEDLANLPMFRDIFYAAAFSDLSRRYPAHLHINLAPQWRGQGIGGRLIDAFAAHAARHGVAGIHAVTGEGSRNNSFYVRCGFACLRRAEIEGKRVAFFGRLLERPGL
jgi:GNAT superfamily N-acetyltransferase